MRLGIVIGSVVLSRCHESLNGARWRLVAPLDWSELDRLRREPPERIAAECQREAEVVYDELHAGEGSVVAFTEGREAANPFHPNVKPIDAYLAAIIDDVDVLPPRTK